MVGDLQDCKYQPFAIAQLITKIQQRCNTFAALH